jgi:RNA polymerase sigma-70 factor (ECF subfamily)
MSYTVDGCAAAETFTPATSRHYADVSACIVAVLPNLRAFARSMTRNRDQAEDLVQDAVVRALSSAEQFTLGTNFRAWIFIILRNLLYNESRKPWSRRTSLEDLEGYEPSVQASQDQSLEFCDFRRAFRQLGSDQQELLILVGAGGMSYQEAASLCNCAVGTVKSRISRARQELKITLSDNGPARQRHTMQPVAGLDLMAALTEYRL